MPPNFDSLKLHTLRANYQARVYRCCMQAHLSAPSPDGSGWKVNNSELQVLWSTLPVAPDCVMNCVYCLCKKTWCRSNKCSCKKAGLKCTSMCHCAKVQCENRQDPQDSDSNSEDDGGDESEWQLTNFDHWYEIWLVAVMYIFIKAHRLINLNFYISVYTECFFKINQMNC